MLNEPGFMPSQAGWIEVICGGKFSAKTEELIRRTRHCFRHTVDQRRGTSPSPIKYRERSEENINKD